MLAGHIRNIDVCKVSHHHIPADPNRTQGRFVIEEESWNPPIMTLLWFDELNFQSQCMGFRILDAFVVVFLNIFCLITVSVQCFGHMRSA